MVANPWPLRVMFLPLKDEDGWWQLGVQWARAWHFGFLPAHTLRHPDPISRVPIWRWRLGLGPVIVARWNREQTPSPHYRER